MRKFFHLFARLSFYLTFLVILAGSIVRATQSGMGCPDWPKCFGYYIPPTSQDELAFMPGKSYEKGQMIILKDTLWRARGNFQSGEIFQRYNWEKYPEHDYARFVIHQTWIEYINRLLGALMGVMVIGLFITSLSFRNENKAIIVYALLMVLLTGFQAWLGALVVSSNLAPAKITIHMLAALILLSINQLIIHRSKILSDSIPYQASKSIKITANILLILIIAQILLGTQVRENIDRIAVENQYLNRDNWIDQLPIIFPIHRSFSLLIFSLISFYLFELHKLRYFQSLKYAKISALVILTIIGTGVGLNYAGFPLMLQPLHLTLGLILFSSHLESFLAIRKNQGTA